MNTELMYRVGNRSYSRHVDSIHPGPDRRLGAGGHGRLSGKPEAPVALGKADEGRACKRRETFVYFAVSVLLVTLLNKTNAHTALGAQLYFWARVVHLFAHTFAMPWIRTIAFTAGFGAQIALAWQLLAR
jgi:uncharacterized MAPEG superfamily protein